MERANQRAATEAENSSAEIERANLYLAGERGTTTCVSNLSDLESVAAPAELTEADAESPAQQPTLIHPPRRVSKERKYPAHLIKHVSCFFWFEEIVAEVCGN